MMTEPNLWNIRFVIICHFVLQRIVKVGNFNQNKSNWQKLFLKCPLLIPFCSNSILFLQRIEGATYLSLFAVLKTIQLCIIIFQVSKCSKRIWALSNTHVFNTKAGLSCQKRATGKKACSLTSASGTLLAEKCPKILNNQKCVHN